MEAQDNYIKELYSRRENILSGKINCIPLEFPRLSQYYYGLEEVGYNVYTASQKVGKSKLVDEMCVYHPFFYSLEHPEQLSVKILYFSLEMSKKRKLYEFLSHLLFKLDDIRISPKDLQSTREACPKEILDLLQTEKYQYYINKFKETVEYITTIKNPTGIYKYCKDFAKSRGHWVTKKGKVKTSSGEIIDGDVNDYFIKDVKNEYWIVVLDNFTNLTLEAGTTKLTNIERMSKYCIELRDDYLFNVNAVQHQSQSQEGIENRKLNQIEPSSDGLGDCKMTTRDIDCLWGLFNPFKYGIKKYPEVDGYDITILKDRVRFLKLLEGRDGGMGISIGLFFDGASSTWKELPPANSPTIKEVYNYAMSLDKKDTSKLFLLFNKIKNKLK